MYLLPSQLGLKNTLIAPLQRGKTPPITCVLNMTLNNLMVRFQQCWNFAEYPFIAIAPRSTLSQCGST